MSLMSDLRSSKFECSVQVDMMDPSLSNSTPMDLLNAHVVYQDYSLHALPQSALIAFTPVLFGTDAALLV